MNGLLIRWLILTIGIIIAAYVIEGIQVSGFLTALGAAALLGFLNAFLRPILLIITLPLNVLTLGLFTLVINAVLLLMASGVFAGFTIVGFWSAVWGAVIIGLISWGVSAFIGGTGRIEVIELRHRGGDRWE